MSTELNAGEARLAVAEEVRSRLARSRLSGVKLAERIGRSQVYVSRRLRGEVPFDVEDLALIAVALDLSVTALLPPEMGGTRRYPHTSDPLAPRLVATVGEPNGGQRRPRIGRGQRAVRLPRPGIILTRRPVTPVVV